jgi:purine nucleosidase
MKTRIQRRQWMAAALLATVLSACGGGGGSDNGGIGLTPGYGAAPPPAQKIIIDSDYNTMSDDGQLGVMAAQLQAQGKVRVMGISVVSGNQWLKQGVADALMSVERLGVGDRIGIYAGANSASTTTTRPSRPRWPPVPEATATWAPGARPSPRPMPT